MTIPKKHEQTGYKINKYKLTGHKMYYLALHIKLHDNRRGKIFILKSWESEIGCEMIKCLFYCLLQVCVILYISFKKCSMKI